MDTIHDYKIIKEVGKGSFGTVYQVLHLPTTRIYVLKVIETGKMTFDQKQMVEDEILAMMDISTDINCSPYIVCYHDSFDISGAKCIVMEYIEGIELFDLILQGNKFNPDQILEWMSYLARGVREIHKKGYAHRDIKAENILIDQTRNIVKIIDLGFICSSRCRNGPGSPFYASPEIFHSRLSGLDSAQAHDIWSLGITFYLLANLRYPFDTHRTITVQGYGYNGELVKQNVEINDQQIIRMIANGQVYKSNYRSPPGSPRSKTKETLVNTIIDLMLTSDWQSRPSIDDILDLLDEKKSEKCNLS